MANEDETILEYLKHLPERLREAREAERQRHLAATTPEQKTAREAEEGNESEAVQRAEKAWHQRVSGVIWLFICGMAFYLVTRFIAIGKFPIYFFSDEAIQTLAMKDLIANGFRDPTGQLLPLYFNNGGQYNLSLSVYLQGLIAWLPNSVTATRGIAALATAAFPLSAGLALRDFFKIKTWWLAPFVISVLPAWFLHSRTAFETCLGASMYALFLYFYLRYRNGLRASLVWAVLFGALAFYAYAPLQLVVVLTAAVLLAIDWRYHFESWPNVGKGVLTLVFVALPYVAFRLRHPQELTNHLYLLRSYWLEPLSPLSKIGGFLKRWLLGLDPSYWFISNQNDLIRHQMKDYAPMGVWTLPFIITGMVTTFRKLKQANWRVILTALLAAPAGAALVEPTITRLMAVVVPLSYLTCLGIDALIKWLEKHFAWRQGVNLIAAGLLGMAGLWMTGDALRNGPVWFDDYGLYGMQWGGEELFGAISVWHSTNPEKEIILTPTWANATDLIARFYLGDPLPVKLDTIQAWGLYYQPPLDESKLFVMTPEEFAWMRESPKFADWRVIHEVLTPAKTSGFYFVTLRYADNVEAVFEQEFLDRKVPVTDSIELFGQMVTAKHSQLDIGTIRQAFDGGELSLIRGFEANPLEIKLELTESVKVGKVTVLVGAPPTKLEVVVTTPAGELITRSMEVGGSDVVRPLTAVFEPPVEAKMINLAVSNIGEPEPAHVHVWEVSIE